jgi:hypothetical protein
MAEFDSVKEGTRQAFYNYCKRLRGQLATVIAEIEAERPLTYQHLVQLQDNAQMVTKLSAQVEILNLVTTLEKTSDP